ncbi:hypothetical protein VE01_06049 [Pseudogymnoascus verrucosus]|uniref:Uncharacterized protein n=1 Tax=Pseudogymnoascus verrucosus TaxID=342668 RepID=A0A1B8GIZ4_9PEZI|nr:uncharacterized protein VE01_06049 [Pseudogymnoascus verrucosus]OBT95827.1 hypothetical protein VE01_06049 [Pseudogymnoascus verrucosus]
MSILTPRDSAILSSLFTAEPPAPASLPPPPPPPGLPNFPSSLLQSIQTLESSALKPLNTASPPASTITTAIEELTSLIEAHPTYPSAYNNRAQALRLLHGSDLTVASAGESGIMADLAQAIRLCTPTTTGLQADILAKAYTQRGAVLLLTSTTMRTLESGRSKDGGAVQVQVLGGRNADEVEEMARADFREGKRAGGEVAGEMDVKMNPVRKLCGEIVREAMVRDLRESGVLPAED